MSKRLGVLLFVGAFGACSSPRSTSPSAQPPAEAGPAGTVLVSGQVPGFNWMGLLGTTLYWTYSGSDSGINGAILRANVDGGDVAVVARDLIDPNGIALDATGVYFVSPSADAGILRSPLDGGAVSTLASLPGFFIRGTTDTTDLYLTSTLANVLVDVPLDGGASRVLASGLANPSAIEVESSTLYWADTGSGKILALPVTGGPLTVLANGQTLPQDLAVDPSAVYWTNDEVFDGGVFRVPIDGGTATMLVPARYPCCVIVDSSFVYWIDRDDLLSGVGAIMAAPKDGGESITLATSGSTPTSLVVDATNLYWLNQGNGTLVTVTKPR